MRVSIEHVLRTDDSSIAINQVFNLDNISRRERPLFPAGLSVEAVVENRSGITTMRYTAAGRLVYDCERCAAQVDRPFSATFAHTVVAVLSDENMEDTFLVAENGILDFEEIVSTDIWLSLPQVLLCGDDCKGLCPICACDLNFGACHCRQDTTDKRFAILKELL
jgi:uncharacterized protein